MSENLRVILVPRYGATQKFDWYSWLEEKLRAKNKFPLGEWVFCDLLPKPESPEPSRCNSHLSSILGTNASQLKNTLIIAHSLGAQIALRTLAEMKEEQAIAGLICVAGWLSLDHPPTSLASWIDVEFDQKAAKAKTKSIINVISGNDPNQIDTRSVTEAWRDGALGAEVVISSKPGHMSAPEEDDVLETVLKHFG